MNSAHTNSSNEEHWYAMRVTYGRELKVQSALKGKFKTYVPNALKRFSDSGIGGTSSLQQLAILSSFMQRLNL